MNISNRISTRIALVVLAVFLAIGSVSAQTSKKEERAKRDKQQTKQAQAVSKEVYDKIQKAQEHVDAQNNALSVWGAVLLSKAGERSIP